MISRFFARVISEARSARRGLSVSPRAGADDLPGVVQIAHRLALAPVLEPSATASAPWRSISAPSCSSTGAAASTSTAYLKEVQRILAEVQGVSEQQRSTPGGCASSRSRRWRRSGWLPRLASFKAAHPGIAIELERRILVPLFDRQEEAPERCCLITTAASRQRPELRAFRNWILREAALPPSAAPGLRAAAAAMRTRFDCTAPVTSTVSAPRARASQKWNSSWSTLLPPKARPVQSSRLIHRSMPREAGDAGKGTT